MRTTVLGIAVIAILSIGTGDVRAQRPRPGLLERLREARAQRAQDGNDAATTGLSFGGLERSYQLLDAHRGTAPVPLVIVLHGGGGNGATMIARWAMQAKAAGIVVAAPNGIGRRDGMGTWNASGCCGEAMSRGADDVGFVGAVIDDVAKRANIDRARIYVTGFSNGGMLTHRVAIAFGNRIAAAAVVSGALFGNEARATAPVPILIMHGEKDMVVDFNGGVSPTGFVARAQSKPFLPVRQTVSFWRDTNGCAAAPAIERERDVTIERSRGCRNGADVQFYDLPQGEHAWPGSPGLGGSDNADRGSLDATATIWAFFQAHAR